VHLKLTHGCHSETLIEACGIVREGERTRGRELGDKRGGEGKERAQRGGEGRSKGNRPKVRTMCRLGKISLF